MGVYLVDILSDKDCEVFVTTRQDDKEDYKNVKFIKGNARDKDFISKVCQEKYDIIIDFMNYNLEEFEENYEILLKATNQYIFLSSCRVFNNSKIINEETSKLLDSIDDQEFLKTNRYALRKAREENILRNSGYNNWTIVRPYITYSDRRLQLGIYEKEEWLYRLLNNKPLIIRKEILDNYTSLASGFDVATGIYNLSVNEKAIGQDINITSTESIKWKDIFDMYLRVLKERLDIEPTIYLRKDLEDIEMLFEGGYNTKYDRLWDRRFDNRKAINYCGDIKFEKILVGLEKCLNKFIDDWLVNGNSIFGSINAEYEKLMDNKCMNKKLEVKYEKHD